MSKTRFTTNSGRPKSPVSTDSYVGAYPVTSKSFAHFPQCRRAAFCLLQRPKNTWTIQSETCYNKEIKENPDPWLLWEPDDRRSAI